MGSGPQDTQKPYYHINVVEKAFKIIDFLSENQNLTVTEIAKGVGQDRSTCNRLLLTLRDLGYITTDGQSQYRLALKLFEIGNRIPGLIEIIPIAQGYMKKLAKKFKQTVNLGRSDGTDIVTIDVISGHDVIRLDAPIGNRSPLHTLAMGKAILAFRSKEGQETYLSNAEFQAFTSYTITDKDRFRQELSKIRKQGFAIDDEEWAMDIRCVAAPIFDHTHFPTHAISISGPAVRLSFEQIDHISTELTLLCRTLSKKLGGDVSS